MICFNSRAFQHKIINYIVNNMEKVDKETLLVMYEMEYDLYAEGALDEKEHEHIRKQLEKQLEKYVRKVHRLS